MNARNLPESETEALKVCVLYLEWIASGGHPMTHFSGVPTDQIQDKINSVIRDDEANEPEVKQ